MKIKLCFISVLLTLTLILKGQNKVQFGIGVNGGITTGVGLAFQMNYEKISVRLAGMPFDQVEGQLLYNIGSQITYNFFQKKRYTIGGFIGNAVFINGRTYFSFQDINAGISFYEEELIEYKKWNVGIGAVGEIALFKDRLSIDLGIGIGQTDILDNRETEPIVKLGITYNLNRIN